jgi:indole-3-glycerol phosphate synthase
MTKISPGTNVLEKIADTVRHRLIAAQARVPFAELQAEWQNRKPKPKDFIALFAKSGLNVIAEVKKASPSLGDINTEIDHNLVARDYLSNGAVALSVLTEPVFFKGQLSYLQDIRRNHPDAYLLQKDFIIDGYQLYEAALVGADAILIIIAMLGEKESQRLYDIAQQLGLSALVEVHNEEELEIAIRIGAKLIGVNNRNLKSMDISLETSRRLIGQMPVGTLPIAESGITSHQDIQDLRAMGYRGFLVGTQLMQTGTPGLALKGLLGS